MIDTVKRTSRNVKRWQNGDMCLRWTAAGMLEAQRQFRRVIGYPQLAKLTVAVERDIARHTLTDTSAPEVAASASEIISLRRPPPKFHGLVLRSARSDACGL